ncbi:MAG: helix-turn-helix transcriptional regulator [Anaerolineaceae bacterium]|nr:helix-turn-helix transcriptional regulator [Anaerolineaceae bacterium]
MNYRERLIRDLKDPDFRKEWDALEPEFQIAEMIINARIENSLTQKELAERSGVGQASLSRIETGSVSPDIATLQKIAGAIGKKLVLSFE